VRRATQQYRCQLWGGGRLPETQDEITGLLMWSLVIGEKLSVLRGFQSQWELKGRGADVAVRCQLRRTW